MSTLPVYHSSSLIGRHAVAHLLGLTETDVEDIKEDGKKTQDKRYKTLRKWKDKNLFKATYGALIDIFLKLGRADLAEKVCRLLVNEGTYKLAAAFLLTMVLHKLKARDMG